MLDVIIEGLIELAFEGMIEGSKSSRVPKPIRYILRFLIFAVFAALTGVCVIAAVSAFCDGSIAFGICMIAVTSLVIGGTAAVVRKVLRGK